MKKLLIIAAVAGFALTSCTNDNEESQVINEKQQISFANPVVNGITRANVTGEMGTVYDMRETFRVFGQKGTDKFANWGAFGYANEYDAEGTEVFYSDVVKGWDSKKPHYWDGSSYYTFAAYSPATITAETQTAAPIYGSTGLQITDFTPCADVADQYDLMYAPRVYDVQSVTYKGDNVYNGVQLNFKHALSAINFKVGKAEGYEGNATFRITGIKISDIFNQASFNENINEAATSDDGNVMYEAAPEWTPAPEVLGTFDFFATTKSMDVTKASPEAKDAEKIAEKGILIPQTLPNAAAIEVTWRIFRPLGDGSLPEKGVNIKGEDADEVSVIYLNNDMRNPITEEWKMGYRYTYCLGFSENRIYFAPNVEKWIDANQSIVM